MKINLEKEVPDYGDTTPSEPKKTKTICPDLYLSDLDATDKIPESGTATVTYRIRRDSTEHEDGKVSRDVTLDISDIEFKAGGKKADDYSADEEVDKNFKEAEAADEDAAQKDEET